MKINRKWIQGFSPHKEQDPGPTVQEHVSALGDKVYGEKMVTDKKLCNYFWFLKLAMQRQIS